MKKTLVLAMVIAVFATGPILAEEVESSGAYPLETCPVMGGKLGSMGDPVTYVHDGREVKFCCQGCVGTFEKKADEYWKKVDEAIVEQQLPYYPLDTCVVSGGKLGNMGDPVNHVYKNRLVRFCCNGCVGAFEKNSERYLKKLNKAVVRQQKWQWNNGACPVEGNKLDASSVSRIIGGRLVEFCSQGCVATFEMNPAAYGDKLPDPTAKKPEEESRARRTLPDRFPCLSCNIVSG